MAIDRAPCARMSAGPPRGSRQRVGVLLTGAPVEDRLRRRLNLEAEPLEQRHGSQVARVSHGLEALEMRLAQERVRQTRHRLCREAVALMSVGKSEPQLGAAAVPLAGRARCPR
jgi:hypothetical protein